MENDIEKLMKELKYKKDKVGYILEKYPRARDDYAELYLKWMQIFGGLPYLERDLFLTIIHSLKDLETVGRMARKYWEKGLYLPSDPKILKRRKREVIFREVIKQV